MDLVNLVSFGLLFSLRISDFPSLHKWLLCLCGCWENWVDMRVIIYPRGRPQSIGVMYYFLYGWSWVYMAEGSFVLNDHVYVCMPILASCKWKKVCIVLRNENKNWLFNVVYFYKTFNFMLVNLFWLFFENASLETFTYLSFIIILFLLFGTEAAMLMPIRILYVFVFVGYPFNFMHFNVFGFCLKNIFFEDVNVSSILEECICK